MPSFAHFGVWHFEGGVIGNSLHFPFTFLILFANFILDHFPLIFCQIAAISTFHSISFLVIVFVTFLKEVANCGFE
jgi:hypothetical protein